MATECFCLVINDQGNVNIIDTMNKCSLGEYLIEWRRVVSKKNFNDSFDCNEDEAESNLNDKYNVITRIKLPEINVEFFPFLIETSLPSYGHLDEQLVISYLIKNKTDTNILDIECTLNENEFFSIGGNKLVFKKNF